VPDLIANALFLRAVVVGVFGGLGLALTIIYSRRGPMIYPVYAALLAALALLLARHDSLPYMSRATGALAGFVVANVFAYAAVAFKASRERRFLVAQGRLPPDAKGVTLLGHLWRWGFLISIAAIVSAAIAYVAG
jgi:hypothetical protein